MILRTSSLGSVLTSVTSESGDQTISPNYLILNIFSSLKLRQILYLTTVNLTLRPFYSRGRISQYPLNMMLTGLQTQSEGCREGKVSTCISCRKLKDHCLVAHHVASTLTQTEIDNYYMLIKSGSSSTFSVPYCGLLENDFIRILLCNTVF
jgi:hypothetical protein